MLSKGRLIAISGAHGTGKTTAAYALAAELKRSGGENVGLIMETARHCPMDVLQEGTRPTRRAQLWIFTQQMRSEIEATMRYDVTVSDRSVVDCIAYSSVCGFHGLTHGQLALARHHVSIYDRVLFFGIADNPYLVNDGFRHLDACLQREVESRMLELYAELGVKIERQEPKTRPENAI